MPTQMTQEQIEAKQREVLKPKTPIYRKLLVEKFSAQTDREKVLTSIIIAIAEDVDRIKMAIKFLSDQDMEIGASLSVVTEAVFGNEEVETGQTSASAGGDKTPFPAGAKPTVVANSAGPLPDEGDDEVTTEGEVPKPNVTSGPARNTAPIPKASGPKAPTPNAGPTNGPAKGVRP